MHCELQNNSFACIKHRRVRQPFPLPAHVRGINENCHVQQYSYYPPYPIAVNA
jgi:hypothetical protein